MPSHPQSLYGQCLKKTAWLLRNSYWSHKSEVFKKFSSVVVDDLIISVTQASKSEILKSSHLRLLVTSGRVRNFVLKNEAIIKPSDATIKNILNDLSTACHDLVSVEIKLMKQTTCHAVTQALNSLLSVARKVKYLESDIAFDLRVLRNNVGLEELTIYFEPINNIYDFLQLDEHLKPNYVLTHLKICHNDVIGQFLFPQIHIILKYCTELVSTNIDIAQGLELLHAAELNNGSLTHTYKIRDCILGNCINSASENSVRIASLTCPVLESLTLIVTDVSAISGLINFHNLDILTIHWNTTPGGDYATALQQLLEKKEIGHNIYYLWLENFLNVDLSSIGECCPNLGILFLFGISLMSNPLNAILPVTFRKLQTLKLQSINNGIVERDQITKLLCSAVNLKNLTLRGRLTLSDDILEDVLSENPLSKLERLKMSYCHLSLEGISRLANTATSLQCFNLDLTDLREEILTIFHEINPGVYVRIL